MTATWLTDFYDQVELDQIRRQVVAYWSGRGISEVEIAVD